jgi:phosphatidylserine/phosphatidylglycerophosphate/cardiolipin synthase-like enzyme
VHEAFPRVVNLAAIGVAQLPMDRIVLRAARPSAIAHNKFMVRVTAAGPSEVWTGSTNLSQGGVSGQTNVGHWVRDAAVALAFERYWQLLSTDPGNPGADSPEGRALNKAFRAEVEALSPAPADLRTAPTGTTAVFSPRASDTVLDSYAALLDSAKELGCITFAFGITAPFRTALQDNTADDAIVFMMLEKADRPAASGPHAAVVLKPANNVYEAWGSYLHDPVYQWARETNAGLLGLNTHVSYIHSKFLLIDPLGADPIVVTGSANFSTDSTDTNDENMLVVRGDRRVADIYWTEFNRLFNHYYFRSVTESVGTTASSDASLFLVEDASWQDKYAPGRLRAKRLALFADLAV